MRITELDAFSGTPGASDYLATDNGDNTSKIPIQAIIDASPPSLFYGTCSTAAGTTAKVVSCTDFKLKTGAVIAVKFTNRNTATSSCTLNVNSTGAKTIYGTPIANGSATNIAGAWENNEVKLFVYDGTYWRLVNQNIITSAELDELETLLGL